jgi:hypothetical protein
MQDYADDKTEIIDDSLGRALKARALTDHSERI